MDILFEDDGGGANLYDYPLKDIEHDYNSMLKTFGESDVDVVRYKRVVDALKGAK